MRSFLEFIESAQCSESVTKAAKAFDRIRFYLGHVVYGVGPESPQNIQPVYGLTIRVRTRTP